MADILQAPHQSFSRAGRMTDSMASYARINQPPRPAKPLDLSKALSIAEIHDDVEKGPADSKEGERDAELCSSARVHPTLGKKLELVKRVEKEIAFEAAMKNVMKPVNDSHPSKSTCSTHSRIAEFLNHAKEFSQRKPKEKNTSGFLSPERQWGSRTASSPPVGHYHPRYDAVEIEPPAVTIAKDATTTLLRQRSMRKRAAAAASKPINATLVLNGSFTLRDLDTTQSPSFAASVTKASETLPTKSDAKKEEIRCTSAFASKVPRLKESKSRHSPVSELKQPTYPQPLHVGAHFVMKQQLGREEFYRQVPQSPDLFYNKPLPKLLLPTYEFRKQVPRERARSLRLSRDVPSAFLATEPGVAERTKFRKAAMLVDMSHQTSRDVVTNQQKLLQMEAQVGTSELSNVPLEPPKSHVYGIDLTKLGPHKSEKMRLAQDCVYEPNYDVSRPKNYDVKISSAKTRPADQPTAAAHIEIGRYQTDSPLLHRRIVHNITVGKCGRETRAQSSEPECRVGFVDVNFSSQEARVKGNPMLSTHVSRETRMKVVSPSPCFLDRTYDFSVDTLFPSKRAAVNFTKAVHRAEHMGSYFANASRAMLHLEKDSTKQHVVCDD